nr:hypothetical protein [uncultured bacterium]
MNFRLASDEVRVRLTVDDVQRLREEGRMSQSIAFSAGSALALVVEVLPRVVGPDGKDVEATVALEENTLRARISNAAFEALVAAPKERKSGLRCDRLTVEIDLFSGRAPKRSRPPTTGSLE